MNSISRRSFLTSPAAGGAAFVVIKPQLIKGWGGAKLRAGLIGCGARGTQAAVNLLCCDENVELVAMGDLFPDRLQSSIQNLRDAEGYVSRQLSNAPALLGIPAAKMTASVMARVQVNPDRQFTGFDAYRKVIDSGVDLVLLCTPPGYRPLHFEAAIEAGKHVFCEKPFGVDATGVRRFMEAVRKSEQKKLTVMSGAQRRSQNEYVETVKKIQDGAIGEIRALYAYWIGGPVIHVKERDPKWSDMEWQHRAWYSHVWICGDQVVEQHLHNIDVCNWVLGAHPVRVVASGGAAWRPRTEVYGNIYDHLSADFEYANGVRLSSYCRQYPRGAYNNVSEKIVGSKGVSNAKDMGQVKLNPYIQEHLDMLRSIRGDGPYINQGMEVAESTMTCIMAREAAYSGLEITWDMIMSSRQDLMPKQLSWDAKIETPPLPVPGEYQFV